MNMKLLGLLMMTFMLANPTYGVNHKRLELEADIHKTRIFSGIPSDESMIKSSVSSFLSENETFEPKYTQHEAFLKFYSETIPQVEEDSFLMFSTVCKKIYDESDSTHKAGIYMLLEKVTEKSLKQLATLKKLQQFKKQYDSKPRSTDADSTLNYFLNIDSIEAR